MPSVEITRDEYDAVKPARMAIGELIAIEEKFDAVMENYVELEETIHNLGIRLLAFETRNYEEMAAPLNHVSRRVSNLLSSTRLYRDALPQHARQLLGRKHPAVQPLLSLKSDSPEHPMAYRQMEAVRNYAQHVGPAINNLTFKRHRDVNENGDTTGFAFSVVPHMDAEAISLQRDVAEDLREAFRSLGDQPNPMPLIRQYIEHFGKVHAGFLNTVKSLETDRETTMRGLLSQYAEATPGEQPIGVAAVFANANGTFENPEYLSEHRLDYLRYLRVKHPTATNLARRYVPW
ncbi:hypothetical protein IVB11_31365 [Bradyrhizobium sp. 177]|uniref:hypothetical protein n=1 Tax=Bradyrhizobium sp. 177 TaxID=2782647 RepID=UPI001FFAEC7E|nr:hypothetical protein [Bradyrhizobium sp. 177]MCK1553427.1 hypothetical protein [Bradyrhizobium sp. 177]